MNTTSGGGAVNSGTVYVLLVPPDKRKLNLAEFEQSVTPMLSENARHLQKGAASKMRCNFKRARHFYLELHLELHQ